MWSQIGNGDGYVKTKLGPRVYALVFLVYELVFLSIVALEGLYFVLKTK